MKILLKFIWGLIIIGVSAIFFIAGIQDHNHGSIMGCISQFLLGIFLCVCGVSKIKEAVE